jgi:hypothetical protein
MHMQLMRRCAVTLSLPPPCAATTRSNPHVHVSGVTTKPQRPFTGSSKNRKSLKLLVAIQRGKAPIVIHLAGSTYEGCPPIAAFHCANGTAAGSGMSAEEYCAAVKAILRERKVRAAQQPSLVLWHDRDTAHRALATTDLLNKRKVKAMVLPPRSPDLDPLDYGVFGAAKRRLAVQRTRGRLAWDAACQLFVSDLRTKTNSDAAIDELPLRLQACLDVRGGHIEDRLKALKKQRPAKRSRCS